ncbi:hypothetical protein [Moraxella lincolnii]|nr:hypothetical protein [Moraxella lincolnii]
MMDWLKDFILNLPLDDISNWVSRFVFWWSDFVKEVPAEQLPLYAYVGGSVLVLLLWILVVRALPKPIGGMSWVVLLAVLLTPGTAAGDSVELAPASIGVVYGLLTKDHTTALTSLLPIMVVIVVGLFLGFLWQLIRTAIEQALYEDKKRRVAEQLDDFDNTDLSDDFENTNYDANH